MLMVVLCCQSVGLFEGGVGFWKMLCEFGVFVLLNIVGCYFVDEVYMFVQMLCEVFEIDWIKLEVIGDDYMLQFDMFVLLVVVECFIKDGFKVLLYCIEDFVLCCCLFDVGCQVLMLWVVFIGIGCGLINLYGLCLLCECLFNVLFIVDVGLGVLLYVMQVMEWGYDVVLFNIVVV